MWIKIKSALISGVMLGVLAMAGYVVAVGDLWKLNLHELANIGVISALAAIVSLIKSMGTTEQGRFAGVQVK